MSGEEDDSTVLIVEDEKGVAELFGLWLSEFYTVKIAYSGTEALEKFDESVDVILLDRRMPGLSGDELLERLQERGFHGQIAFVSGVEPDEGIADMPIDDYLTKPVSKERLEGAVDKLLLREGKDAAKQELLGLISRKIVLERRYHAGELSDSREYEQLSERIEEISRKSGFSTQRISSKYRPDECPNCELRWDVSVSGGVGFLDIGSNVWECKRCGEVIYYADPSDRKVARR